MRNRGLPLGNLLREVAVINFFALEKEKFLVEKSAHQLHIIWRIPDMKVSKVSKIFKISKPNPGQFSGKKFLRQHSIFIVVTL